VRERARPAGFVVVLCGALAGACANPQPGAVDFTDRNRNYSSRDYAAVYGRWTRHGKAVHGLDNVLEVWATYKSFEFREAFVEHYADLYRLPEAERQRLRASEHDAARDGYDFHVTAQSTEFRWNDLENDNTAWRITLVDGAGRQLAPESVELPKLPDAFVEEFFPDRTPFSRTYRIRFRPPAEATQFAGTASGRLTLSFAGPLGHVDLTWRGR